MAQSSDPAPYRLVPRLLAEAFGTFTLVFGIVGTAVYSSADTGLLGVALAAGLSVIAAAYAVGHISGGHFNPAVSIGVAAAGRMPWRDVGPYVLAQFVGALLAAALLFLIAANGPEGFLAGAQDARFGSNGFDDGSPGGFGLGAVILIELLLTALFLYVILGTTAPWAMTPGFPPLAIGLTLTLIHLISIPVSNTSVNPARSLAPAVFGGIEALSQVWVFLVFPVLGALLAGYTYRILFPAPATAPSAPVGGPSSRGSRRR